MNRMNKNPFNPSLIPQTTVSGFKQMPSSRVPQHFIEAMKRISGTSDVAPKAQPKKEDGIAKWKSSFKPLEQGQKHKSFQDETTNSERTELYDPSNPLSSDSEPEMPQSKDHKLSPPKQDNKRCQQLSPDTEHPDKRPWESSRSELTSRPLDRREFNAGTKPLESRALIPGHLLPERHHHSPEAEPLSCPGYDFASKPLDQIGHSPDSYDPNPSTQHFPASYGGPSTNGQERITEPEYRKEMLHSLGASPPRLKRDYPHHSRHMETGLDQDQPSRKVPRKEGKMIKMENCPITCDLCDIMLANAEELEDHLDSRSHWDTLEHIQQSNHYDDLVIAFLQEVMMYKSQHCSRAIEDSALHALQENDHMIKVGLFHCAACKVYISTSAADVQAHITSQEHLFNTKEFEEWQRRSCLSKAETMIKELKPQLENFLKGGSPFERNY
ncbi:uncharacterized protein LOC121643941 [Melanotaenia boesemani]|uniref:uncharacterized protein LOC121643941 n=1 Tax=Melanotaenia boesemani TaxID=1250792 RepID=UPI001C03BB09|nr:uncharacterized protein LOC121643941 [Melanotaenia boesemani]